MLGKERITFCVCRMLKTSSRVLSNTNMATKAQGLKWVGFQPVLYFPPPHSEL